MATHMFEVYYTAPINFAKEAHITDRVATFGGRLDYREEPDAHQKAFILTYEFDTIEQAQSSANDLRQHGEHVKGPFPYGNSMRH